MTDANATPPSAAQPLARLAFSESIETGPAFLGTVTVSKASGQKLEFGCNVVSEALARVSSLIEKFQADGPSISVDLFDLGALVDYLRNGGSRRSR